MKRNGCRECSRLEPGIRFGFWERVLCKKHKKESWQNLCAKVEKITSSEKFKKETEENIERRRQRIKKYYENKRVENA